MYGARSGAGFDSLGLPLVLQLRADSRLTNGTVALLPGDRSISPLLSEGDDFFIAVSLGS